MTAVLTDRPVRRRPTGVRVRAERRPDIQGLRAVAVLLVVLYHCGLPWLPGGYVGVDVFFVISGFLITSHLLSEIERTGTISLRDFYVRRMRRLLPPALLVIAVTVVVARLWGPPLRIAQTAEDGFFATFYLMNYRLAVEGVDYQNAGAAPSPLQHFWSLAVEEQFYLLWPVCLVAVALLYRAFGSRMRRGDLAIPVLGIVGVSLAASVVTTGVNAPMAYYSLQTRAWELGVGALVAIAVPLLRRLPEEPAGNLAWWGLGLVIASAVLFTDATAFPGYAAALPVVGTALAIAGGTVRPRNGLDRGLGSRPVQLIGNVSYGWYLWHWPALMLGPYLFKQEFGLVENLEISFLALWLAILTYLLIERWSQVNRWGRAAWFRFATVLSTLVTAIGLVVVWTSPAIQGNGAQAAPVSVGDFGQLQSALASGLALRAVPANLDPALDAAAEDVPETSIKGCHVTLLTTDQGACAFGDVGAKRTIVLFGDSHAEQWFGALEPWAIENGWRLVSWTKVACPLADTPIVNEQLGRRYTECETWRSERLAALKKLHPDVIVASQADSLVPVDFSNSAWASATERTLRKVSSSADHLIFLSDTPRASMRPAECLADHLDDASRCVVPSDEGLARAKSTYAHLPGRHRAVVNAISVVDLTFVRTEPWFCIETRCPAVVGDSLVYRDEGHITQKYIATLRTVLGSVIEQEVA